MSHTRTSKKSSTSGVSQATGSHSRSLRPSAGGERRKMGWVRESERKYSLSKDGEKVAWIWWDKEYEVAADGRWLLFGEGGFLGELPGIELEETEKAKRKALRLLLKHHRERANEYEKAIEQENSLEA